MPARWFDIRSWGFVAIGAALIAVCLGVNVKNWDKTPYDVQGFSDGLAAARDASGRWGFVDENRNFVITPKYDGVGSFRHGEALVAFPDRRQWCLIDEKDQLVSERSCTCDLPTGAADVAPRDRRICYEATLMRNQGKGWWGLMFERVPGRRLLPF